MTLKSFLKAPSKLSSLLWIMVFDHTSLNIAFPILTLLFFDTQSSLFAADTAQAERSMWYGLCIGIPYVLNILITPLLSALSDKYGRKPILIIGALGAFLFSVTAALSVLLGMLSLLFLARFIQGAFSRTNPIAQAVVGDISDKQNKIRNMGYLQFSISVGAFIGPILGGYFAKTVLFPQFNFSIPYFIAAGFAIVGCFLTLFSFTETHPNRVSSIAKDLTFANFKLFINRPAIFHVSMVLLLSQISWSLYYQFIPPVLKLNLLFGAEQLGLFVGMIAFWLGFATLVMIRLLDRILSLRQMLVLSLYLVLIGLVVTAVSAFIGIAGAPFIWLAAAPVAIGDVIAYSCLTTYYSDAVSKEEQGKVMGVCFVIVALIWSLVGFVGGLLMSHAVLLPLMLAPLGIIAAVFYIKFNSTAF